MNWIHIVDMLVLVGAGIALAKERRWIMRFTTVMFTLAFLTLYGSATETTADFGIAVMHVLFLVSTILAWRFTAKKAYVVERTADKYLPPFDRRMVIVVVMCTAASCAYLLAFRARMAGSFEAGVLGMRTVKWTRAEELPVYSNLVLLAWRSLGPIALALSIAMVLDRRYRKTGWFLTVSLVLTYVLFIAFASGRRSGPVVVAIVVAASMLAFHPRLPKYAILKFTIAGLLALNMATVASVYRSEGLSLSELDEALVTCLNPKVVGGMLLGVSENDAIKLVLWTFPERINYLWGYSIYTIVVNPIPRAFWPSKPVGYGKLLSFEFYGNTPQFDIGHSVSTGVMGEGYANFGWLGVPLSGIMIGVYLGVTTSLLLMGRRNIYATAIGAHLLAHVHPMLRGSWLVNTSYWFYPPFSFALQMWLWYLVFKPKRQTAYAAYYVPVRQ